MIDNNIDHLTGQFKVKAQVFLSVVKTKYPNVAPFETKRTLARQIRLKNNRKSKTINSLHLKGLAVDWVFLNSKGQPTRKGDYNFLHMIGAMCGMKHLTWESCHLEDSGKTIKSVMATNSARYNVTRNPSEQKYLSLVNSTFRSLGC